MKSIHPSSPDVQPGRHLEVLDEPVHDARRDAEKLSAPAVCTECGAVYRGGYWEWTSAPAHATQIRCPACRRSAEGRPAAWLAIEGRLAGRHAEDIARLIREVEHRERSAHPLRRVMALDAREDGMDVATTDVRLAQTIGETLADAYGGRLDAAYNEDQRLLRMHWTT